nr:hypothetical protein [uncultured Desulfobacter sp.]
MATAPSSCCWEKFISFPIFSRRFFVRGPGSSGIVCLNTNFEKMVFTSILPVVTVFNTTYKKFNRMLLAMKIPVSPPDFIKIITEKSELFAEAFNASVTDEKGRYLHWDKLRHLTPPDDFTSEEWWAVIRFKRQNLFTTLPLYDKSNQPFKFCTPDAVNRDLHWLRDHTAGDPMDEKIRWTNLRA